jgi:uncharacterized protein DUF6186
MSTRTITIVGFVAVIVTLVVLEILGRSPRNRIPTLGEWLGYVMRSSSGRALILLGWLWLGWHYFARLAQPASGHPLARACLAPDRTPRPVSLSYAA